MTGGIPLAVPSATPTLETRLRELMPSLLSYFVRRVTPREDAADCLSETLVVLWRRQSEIPPDDDQLRAWSFGIARGVLANQRRSHLRRTRLAERLRDDLADAPAPADSDPALHDALASLRERDRELVTLIVWDGFGVAEAGALLGLSAAASRTRYSRARSALRSKLS